MFHPWIKWHLIVEGVLSFSGTDIPWARSRSSRCWTCELCQGCKLGLILWVNNRGLLWTISRTFCYMLKSGTTSLSDCTQTLGRQPVSHIVWWSDENTPLEGILLSGKHLRYSSTAACTLPLQNMCMKCMSQYLAWENAKAFLRHLTINCSMQLSHMKLHREFVPPGCWLKDWPVQRTDISSH